MDEDQVQIATVESWGGKISAAGSAELNGA